MNYCCCTRCTPPTSTQPAHSGSCANKPGTYPDSCASKLGAHWTSDVRNQDTCTYSFSTLNTHSDSCAHHVDNCPDHCASTQVALPDCCASKPGACPNYFVSKPPTRWLSIFLCQYQGKRLYVYGLSWTCVVTPWLTSPGRIFKHPGLSLSHNGSTTSTFFLEYLGIYTY